jgi:uncharacterized RDD family membrane protein YckC
VYSGFWRRLGASFIDGLIIGVPMAIVILLLGDSLLPEEDEVRFSLGGVNPFAGVLANLLSIAVGVLYYGLLEGGPKGQTVGKQALSIRVVDATTFQPGVGVPRGIGRYFARWLSQLPLYLGYFWMLWDPRKQTWHDKLTRTVVVRTDL